MLEGCLLQQLHARLARGLDANHRAVDGHTAHWGGQDLRARCHLGPQVPAMLAADLSSKEMFEPAAGKVTGATLKPVAV